MGIKERLEAARLVSRAVEIQVSETEHIEEAEHCLLRAIELDPMSVEALQEAAHFYYAVNQQPEKARQLAVRCREAALKVATEMDKIRKAEM